MSMSKEQLKQLGIAASAAVKHQRMVGAFEVPPDMRGASKTAQNEFWRHQQVAIATQRVCSFKDMADLRPQGGADEYQLVMQHFAALAGPFWKEQATTRTGKLIDGADCDRAPGCEYVRDMCHWMAKAAFRFPHYCLPIMGRWRDAEKNKITDIRLLRTWQLKQLHDTVVNRCRSKLGLGDPGNRNKKARGMEGNAPALPKSAKPELCPPPASPPAAGSPPAPSRSRGYVLKPRSQAVSHVPRGNMPF